MSYAGAFTDKNNTDHPITSTLYGTCATAANEAAKVVVCTDFDTLLPGVTIRVKFSNGNTAANPTININSTGAKSVFRFGSTAPVGAGSWEAGAVVELTYDGTSFFMTNSDNIAAKQNVTDNTLQTTAKDVPGAINELKSGLNGLGTFVLLAHEEMAVASQWTPFQNISINVNAYRYIGVRLTHASDTINGTPLCLYSREEFLESNASKPLCALFNTTELNDAYNVYVHYNAVSVTPLFYFRGANVSDTLYMTIFGIV